MRSTRRETLRQLSAAAAGFAVAPVALRGQASPIVVGGKPAEIIVASVSPSTVRLTIAAIGGEMVRNDGTLVRAARCSRAALQVVLHIVIEGRRMSGTVSEPCTPDKAVPSGRTPDDRWPEDRAVQCYWPYHKPLFDLGVGGWWPDQGDGLDSSSRLARTRMYWEGPQL